MGKSAAQIRRMQKRAQERGQSYTYEAPPKPVQKEEEPSKDEIIYKAALKLQEDLQDLEENPKNLNSKEKRSAKRKAEAIALEAVKQVDESIETSDALLEWFEENKDKMQSSNKKKKGNISKEDQKKFQAAKTYNETMESIENDEEMNSKDRRSAKRKAEAIALEECGMESIDALNEWVDANQKLQAQPKKEKKEAGDSEKKPNPYILFVGQIPFNTTSEELFKHFQTYMGKEIIASEETMQIRIPKDDKTKKPKGFAFVEFTDPEIMYECLKMHHTPLNGRRINVLRSAGGGKAARAEKNKQRKQEQDEYISTTVDKIIADYIKSGQLKEGELDNGAILLCKRRSAATVEAALTQYIEKKGDREFQNPSAFFTNLMCKVTDEGAEGLAAAAAQSKKKRKMEGSQKSNKKPQRSRDASVFTKSGVDMSISDADNGNIKDLTKIFPSMGRGRGRGRGAYMR